MLMVSTLCLATSLVRMNNCTMLELRIASKMKSNGDMASN